MPCTHYRADRTGLRAYFAATPRYVFFTPPAGLLTKGMAATHKGYGTLGLNTNGYGTLGTRSHKRVRNIRALGSQKVWNIRPLGLGTLGH